MISSANFTPDQQQLLAELGHLHLVLESHQRAAQYCIEQIQSVRTRLEALDHQTEPKTS